MVYELTEYGSELEDVVVRLGRWGAKSLTQPGPGEIVTPDSMVMAMRSTFRSEAARGLTASYELHSGPVVIHMRITDGRLEVGKGPLHGADLVIETRPGIKALMTGELTPAQAIDRGIVRVSGDPTLLERFAQVFRI